MSMPVPPPGPIDARPAQQAPQLKLGDRVAQEIGQTVTAGIVTGPLPMC
jgi:hypothetical protein